MPFKEKVFWKLQCSSLIKHASTDTILSISISDPPGLPTQTPAAEVPMAEIVTSSDGRCKFCQMRCRGPTSGNEAAKDSPRKSKLFPGEHDELVREEPRKSKQPLLATVKSDEYTWTTRGNTSQSDKMAPSLSVIKEEGQTSKHDSLGPPSPSSEKTYSTARLLMPDVALSDSTYPSIPAKELHDTAYSDQSCRSDKNRMPGRSSSTLTSDRKRSPSCSPRKGRNLEKSEKLFTEGSSLGSDNLPSFKNKRVTRDGTCNRICPYGSENEDNPNTDPEPPTSLASTVPDKKELPTPKKDLQKVNEANRKDAPPKPVCDKRTCRVDVPSRPQKPRSPCSEDTKNHRKPFPEMSKSNNRRGYLEGDQLEAEKLAAPGKQNIFADESRKDSPRKSVKLPDASDSNKVKFQICPDEDPAKTPCSTMEQKRNKQPILIKLFPTSSKDGVFSWEANPIRPSGNESESSKNAPPISNPPPGRTDDYVQTSSPKLVDTQTSAVFATRERTVHYSRDVKDASPEVKGRSQEVKDKRDKSPARGASRRSTSGSLVDFVLRPFAVHGKSAKAEDKKSRNDKIKDIRKSKQVGFKTVNSSKLDLLKIQNSNKKGRSKSPEKIKEKPTSPRKSEKSPRKCNKAEVDICSIYYSSIQGKLYQPTRSGLLVTESSKEDMDKTGQVVKRLKTETAESSQADQHKKRNSPRQHKCGRQEVRTETRTLTRTKRKSDDEGKSKRKCAKQDESELEKVKIAFGDEISLPWQKAVVHMEKPQMRFDPQDKDKLAFMFPPFNLDFSSGACDDSKTSSNRYPPDNSVCTYFSTDQGSKPCSPGTTQKTQRISDQLSTNRKSSSSYEDVVIEKFVKQKKRTLKKFK